MSSPLLDQITAAVADEYAVLGPLGESSRGSAFLARERAHGHLVVLAVAPAADELAVLAAVGDEVPANAGTCTACGTAPQAFTVHCLHCGRPFVLSAVGAHRFTAAEVTAAAGHAYDVLGEVAHQAGGSLFFVRDRADGRLVALAGQQDAGGAQSLEAVWDAVRGDRTAVSAEHSPSPYATAGAAGEPSFAPSQSSWHEPAFQPAGGGQFDGAEPIVDAPAAAGDAPGYPPEYRDPNAADAPPAGPRRRWVPLAVAGVLVLVGGGAWAAMRGPRGTAAGTTPPADPTVAAGLAGGAGPTPATDSARTGPLSTDSAAARGGATLPLRDSAASVAAAADAAAREARRKAADSAARAQATPAVVTLEGSLPEGWSWTVNGRPGPPSLTARLRPNRPATLSIEAPGYCPEVLQMSAPVPGSTQRWTPHLRGKPMVGEC